MKMNFGLWGRNAALKGLRDEVTAIAVDVVGVERACDQELFSPCESMVHTSIRQSAINGWFGMNTSLSC